MMQTLLNKHFFNLLVFTLIFGILLYDMIGFDFIDEICTLILFLLFTLYLFSTKEWSINKAFLSTIGIFVFYLCYSFSIKSNVKIAILSDCIIQIKPYLAFFCVYSIMPQIDKNKKSILKSTCLIIWILLFIMGICSLFVHKLLHLLMGHPTYYAAAVICTALCYLYCSDFTKKDKLVFLMLLSIGIISGRSKFYGFYAVAWFVILFASRMREFRLNVKNISIILLMFCAVAFVAREKINFYFYQAVTDEVDKDMIARYMLYVTAPQILYDYFPFGSGFASYGTYSSGVYYSKIYSDYGIDGIWGMTKSYYNFIADTFYPSLAQFGVIGVCLFFLFWAYIVKRAYTYYKKNGDNQLFSLVLLIVAFLLIESTTDSTFTTHRGFFVLMLLGLFLSELKRKCRSITFTNDKSALEQ